MSNRRSKGWRSSTKVSSPTEAHTAYAVCWSDVCDGSYGGEYGCRRVFLSRGNALDHAAEVVFARARNRGVEVLDQEEFKNRMTAEEVRDRLGSGGEVRLILGRDCTGEPMEYISVCVCETEIDSRI